MPCSTPIRRLKSCHSPRVATLECDARRTEIFTRYHKNDALYTYVRDFAHRPHHTYVSDQTSLFPSKIPGHAFKIDHFQRIACSTPMSGTQARAISSESRGHTFKTDHFYAQWMVHYKISNNSKVTPKFPDMPSKPIILSAMDCTLWKFWTIPKCFRLHLWIETVNILFKILTFSNASVYTVWASPK